MLYETKEAEFLIRKWMGQTLSNSQQSLAKPELVPAISEDTCYVVSDYAMKWMPQKKKEHPEDWYGKKGLSWHVSCIFHKQDGELVKTTFVTSVDNCKQSGEDAVNCVVNTSQHFTTLHPSIRKCILKNDNASNYHCVTFVVVDCALLLNAIGITVLRVHYSAPGGGRMIVIGSSPPSRGIFVR